MFVLVFQALVHLLRSEGVQLGDSPIAPEDTVKLRPKRYEDQQVDIEQLPEWVTYRYGIFLWCICFSSKILGLLACLAVSNSLLTILSSFL